MIMLYIHLSTILFSDSSDFLKNLRLEIPLKFFIYINPVYLIFLILNEYKFNKSFISIQCKLSF